MTLICILLWRGSGSTVNGDREREGGQEVIAAARELHTNAHGHALRFERLRLREVSGALRRRAGGPIRVCGRFYANDGQLAWVCLRTDQLLFRFKFDARRSLRRSDIPENAVLDVRQGGR
jgi:hypothetical protein